MKNRILIFLVIFYQILFLNNNFAQEIEFDASDIEIINDQNLTIANNGVAKIKDDQIKIEGLKIEYFKDQSLIIVSHGKIIKIDLNLEIKSDIIKYNMKDGIINFTNRVSIYDNSNNLVITSDKITYDVNNQKILGGSNTEITDEFNNTYKVSELSILLMIKLSS